MRFSVLTHCPRSMAVGLSAILFFSMLFISAAVARAADDSQPGARYEIDVRQDVQYGTGGGEKLLLDMATPKGVKGARPVIVYIHGGGWSGGHRKGHLEQVKEAARRGYFSCTLSYRFAPKHLFPAQIEDVKCAIRYLRAHAKELNLDPNRIGAVGFSAGAHLVMMLGTMDKGDGLEGKGGWADQSSKVQAVVSFFGPVDLMAEYPDASKRIVNNFIGGTKSENADAYKRASPITYVNSGDAPMLLYQGTKDVLVPYEQAFMMATAMSKAKVAGRVEFLIGANHGWGGADRKRTLDDTLTFLARHLKK